MNERIKELWRQVELQECDCGCNPDEFLRLKFAELIVRECGRVAGREWDSAETVIYNHFGIEETKPGSSDYFLSNTNHFGVEK